MKTLPIIILSLATLALYAAAPSGTYCVDVGSDVQRVETAFGSILNLGRPATTVEMETAIFNWVEGQTSDYERRQNMTSFSPPPFGNASKYAPKASPSPTSPPAKKK